MINKDILIKECINLLKKPELKKEILTLFRPVVELILKQIYPYILVVISFLLILGIFVIIMRLKIFMIKKL